MSRRAVESRSAQPRAERPIVRTGDVSPVPGDEHAGQATYERAGGACPRRSTRSASRERARARHERGRQIGYQGVL